LTNLLGGLVSANDSSDRSGLLGGLGDLGNGLDSNAFEGLLDGSLGDLGSSIIPELGDLISGGSSVNNNISITEIIPTIKETISNISSGSQLPKFDFSSLLSGFNKQSDIDLTNPWG